MSKLWLIGLAGSAAWTQAGMAQPAAPPPPPPPPMAHSMQAPMSPPGAPMMMHGQMRGGQMGGQMGGHMGGMHRIGRGGIVPPFFMGPQFVIQDWRMFGFPPPMPGGRWVRYYDDALLIDGDGRVMDGRYDWDWDRYGDRGYDDRDGDYDDDEWAEDGPRHGERHRRIVRVYRHDGDGGRGDCRRRCVRVRHLPPPPPPYPGYGYGYGYGAGCGCGGVVITETTTTTAPVVETRTYYETVTERVAPRVHYAKPVRHYSKPVRRFVKPVKRAPPPPRPGERG
jgi:hypothetical protein